MRKILAILLCLLLCFEQTGLAQIVAGLNISGHLASLRNSFAPDVFRPLHLRYLSYDNQNNNFQLLLDKGSQNNPTNKEIEDTAKELLKYFFIGLSLPNDSFWVNLRPDSPNDIIDNRLAQTDVGKIMLEADLQLKKDTARFTSPQTPEGREYWNKLYQRAGEIFGTENITIPTVTRPWIVPDEIIIRESSDSAYVYKATLKVMLEQDYLKDSAVYNFKDDRLKELNEYSSGLIRQTIIPKLSKEINTSKRYAALRQVYYSLIMANWFKNKFQGKNNQYARMINRRDLTNLISKDFWSKDTYFQAYKENFEKGEYNIREPAYTSGGQSIRSYFSGGMMLDPSKSTTNLPAQGGISAWLKKGRSYLLPILLTFTGALGNNANSADMQVQIQGNLPGVVSTDAKIAEETGQDSQKLAMKAILSKYNIHWETGKRLTGADLDNGSVTKVAMDWDKSGGYVVWNGSRFHFEQLLGGGYLIVPGGVPEREDNVWHGASAEDGQIEAWTEEKLIAEQEFDDYARSSKKQEEQPVKSSRMRYMRASGKHLADINEAYAIEVESGINPFMAYYVRTNGLLIATDLKTNERIITDSITSCIGFAFHAQTSQGSIYGIGHYVAEAPQVGNLQTLFQDFIARLPEGARDLKIVIYANNSGSEAKKMAEIEKFKEAIKDSFPSVIIISKEYQGLPYRTQILVSANGWAIDRYSPPLAPPERDTIVGNWSVSTPSVSSAITGAAAGGSDNRWKERFGAALKRQGNRQTEINKAIGLIEAGQRGEKEVILEIGCGNAAVAWEIANKNPNMAVIATDVFDTKSQHGTYRGWAEAFAAERLDGQLMGEKRILPNLVILRSDAQILDLLANGSIDYVLVVNPDGEVVKSSLPRLGEKVRKGIVIKPTGSFENLARAEIGDNYKFNNMGREMWKVNINDASRFSSSGNEDVWVSLWGEASSSSGEVRLGAEPSSGQMKPLSIENPLDEDTGFNLSPRHSEFEKLAASVTPGDVYGIQARVIEADLGYAGAYHFNSAKLGLIIVINSKFDQEIQSEGEYHEAREIFWVKKGFNQHESHVIASAEWLSKYWNGGSFALTPYHRMQLGLIARENPRLLKKIAEENRQWHRSVIDRAIARGGAEYALKYTKTEIWAYEEIIKLLASNLLLHRQEEAFIVNLQEIQRLLPEKQFPFVHMQVAKYPHDLRQIMGCKLVEIEGRKIRVLYVEDYTTPMIRGDIGGVCFPKEDAILLNMRALMNVTMEIRDFLDAPNKYMSGGDRNDRIPWLTHNRRLNNQILELLRAEFGSKDKAEIFRIILAASELHELEHKRQELLKGTNKGKPREAEPLFAGAQAAPYFVVALMISYLEGDYVDNWEKHGYRLFEEIGKNTGNVISPDVFSTDEKKLAEWFEKTKPHKISRSDLKRIAYNLLHPKNELGQMKAISLYGPFDEDGEPGSLEPRHPEFERLARKIKKPDNVFSLAARVVLAPLARAGAYHFYSPELGLIIVVNLAMSEDIHKEGKFHEIREIYWMGQGLNQHEAHIIASAEQETAFAIRQGRDITPYHQEQLKDPLVRAAVRNESEMDRAFHHAVLLDAIKRGADIKLAEMKRYEANLRVAAAEAEAQSGGRRTSRQLQLLTNERIGSLSKARDAFKQQQAARGRAIPEWSVEYGTFWDSLPEMLDDLIMRFGLIDPEKKVLDVGTGDAFTALVLAAVTGAQITSIEIHPDRYQYAIDFINFLRTERGISCPNLTISQENLLRHPVNDYDAVYFYYTFPREKRSEFIQEILAKLSRELKPGAVFISPMLGVEKDAVERSIIQEYLKNHQELVQEEVLVGGVFTRVLRKINTSALDSSDLQRGSEQANLSSTTASKIGGIDFRAMPIVSQAIVNLSMNINRQDLTALKKVDLSNEWQEIEKLTAAGITPSGERIKEYLQASSAKGSLDNDVDKVITCISDILRREEESCCKTETMLRDILVVLESARSAQDLKVVFLGKK